MEPQLFGVRHSHMTLTMNPRRAALVALAAIVLVFVYLIGTSRSGGVAASAASFPSAVGASSSLGSTVPVAGGPGITVAGTAKVAGRSDTLRLDLSVVATASSVSQALAAANRSAAAVQKSLVGSGVVSKDLQTSGLSIQPNYDYSTNGTPRLTGYQASESVSAKLRDLGRAGEAIGKAVSAGGNAVRVNAISLDIEDTGALVSAARDNAFKDAKAKAEQYAKAAGRTLGVVVSIAEDVSTPPNPMPYAADSSFAAGKSSVPIQPGSQDVSVTVTVVFAMT